MSVEITRLPNGFRVVTERMPGLASAALGVWISAGTRHEKPEQNGIAHFLEHMAFKGTARRDARAIAEAIEDVGGYLNAYTSRESTAFYARVLEPDAPLAPDVLGDIILNPLFADDEIEVERGVILQEIGQAHDTPDDIVFDWLQEVAYPEQAIGRPILGLADRVGRFHRADLATFVAERYAPDRMILAAAGAVDHDALVAQAETLFGHLAPRTSAAIEPATFRCGERRELRALEQVHVAMALEAPSYRDEDIYVSQAFASLLGGGMSSRLFQELRERRGLCYTIFAQAGAYEDSGHITIYAGTGEDQIVDLMRLTAEELRRAAERIDGEEIDRARAQLKAGLLMGLESPSQRAERLARMLAIWDRVPDIDETVARIDAVAPADIARLAEAMVRRGPVAIALYGPAERAPDLGLLRERLAA
jgi:predicted Zn-dependent peptidase